MSADWRPGLPPGTCVCDVLVGGKVYRNVRVEDRGDAYVVTCPSAVRKRQRGEKHSTTVLMSKDCAWRPIAIPDGLALGVFA